MKEAILGSTLECPGLTDFLSSSLVTEIWVKFFLLDCPDRDHSVSYRSLPLCQIVLYLKLTAKCKEVGSRQNVESRARGT